MKKSHYSPQSPDFQTHSQSQDSSFVFYINDNDEQMEINNQTNSRFLYIQNRASNEDLFEFLQRDLCLSSSSSSSASSSSSSNTKRSKFKRERRKSLLTSFEDALTINALNPLQKQMSQILDVSHNEWQPPNYNIDLDDNSHSFLSPKLFHSKKLLDSNIINYRKDKMNKVNKKKKSTKHIKHRQGYNTHNRWNSDIKSMKLPRKFSTNSLQSQSTYSENAQNSLHCLRSQYEQNENVNHQLQNKYVDNSKKRKNATHNLWKNCDFLEEKASAISKKSIKRKKSQSTIIRPSYNGKKLNKKRSKTYDLVKTKKDRKLRLKGCESEKIKRNKSKNKKKRKKKKEKQNTNLNANTNANYLILSEDEKIKALMEDIDDIEVEYPNPKYSNPKYSNNKHRKTEKQRRKKANSITVKCTQSNVKQRNTKKKKKKHKKNKPNTNEISAGLYTTNISHLLPLPITHKSSKSKTKRKHPQHSHLHLLQKHNINC